MIKYNYEISVNDNKARLNKDIFLFRGNRNIHYYFSIKGARFTFSKTNEDLIESSNAIYAAVTVIKPNGVEVANAIAPVEDGVIHLKVTEDLIDEEVEVGDFDLVFDLFDDSEGAVTIPKIQGQFHVQERPCTTSIGTLSGNANIVNQAVVDLATATQENEQLVVVDDNGKYVKTVWKTGDKISVERLNKIEEGLEDVSSQYKDIANNFKLVAGANNAIKLMFGTKELSSITINGGTVDPTPTPNTYTVTNNLSNASTSNSATSVKEGTSYSATITASSGYRLKSVTVIMGGVDITSSVYSNGRISISDVTGNISITVTTEYITSEITTYTITNNLSHARNSNTATTIEEKSSYTATITADSNYRIKNVTVTMYGTDITNDVYSGGKIIIPRVIGNIVITVTTEYVSGGGDESNLDGLLKDRLLVWHDEFDDATLDTTKWRYATHNSGGSEQQAYTVGRTENVRLENSNLILEARKDGYVDGWTWSSGRIDTSGLVGFRYGRLEAKLKYDVVSGAFPAFWTIGTCAHYPTGTDIHGVHKSKGTQWAQNGEIDMFEGRGTKSEIAQGGWYNQDDGKGNQTIIFGTKNIDASQYHVYAVEWTETTMISYIDGVETGRKDISNIESWHRPMYIILNMAVGSTGGYPADDCTSMKMEVDWVRVYAPVGVTEKEEVQSISLTQNNVSFNVGDDPIDVYYTVNPSTAWDNNVNYESSNPNVATVYGSRIYPVGTGNCVITARATNGVTATINVTVAQNANINAKSIT